MTTIKFQLNGEAREVEAWPDEPLLDVLRETFKLKSLKSGCAPQRECGACLALIDGQPKVTCAVRIEQVEGRSVTTLEGVAEDERRLYADAFQAAAGLQCGFCTPGFVLRIKWMTDQGEKLTRAEIARVLDGHLCRCTGYAKIIDAVELIQAAKLGGARAGRRRERRRRPAAQALSGRRTRARRAAVRRRHRRARAALWRRRAVGARAGADRQDRRRQGAARFPASSRSRPPRTCRANAGSDRSTPTGPASSPKARRRATSATCSPLSPPKPRASPARRRSWSRSSTSRCPPVLDPAEALKPGAPQVNPKHDNLLSTTRYARGDVEAALGRVGACRQRRHGRRSASSTCSSSRRRASPRPLPDGRLHIYSQGQGIFDDRRQIAAVLGEPEERLFVELAPNGGAFGGKEDMTIQAQTALLARLTGRPVRIALNREESIRIHPKRHPLTMTYTVGCDAEGRLTAVKADILGDSGAYASVGGKVLERAAGHACGPYRTPAVAIESVAAYTNNPPCGAMRGFGVNQTSFAIEGCLDLLAAKVGSTAGRCAGATSCGSAT